MLALLRFFQRTHLFWLYLFYMIIALKMIGNNRKMQGFKMHAFFMNTTAGIRKEIKGISDYVHLKRENRKLQEENRRLYNIIYRQIPPDTKTIKGFRFTEANTVYTGQNPNHRFIIIDKGRDNGVKIEDGVMNARGVVGIVSEVSKHFSKVLLLNDPQVSIDVKLPGKQGYGFTQNYDENQDLLQVVDWPEYLSVSEGDSLVTGGMAMVFPPGFPVGKVVKISFSGNTAKILLNPFATLNDPGAVYIVSHPLKEELSNLINEN